MKLIIKVLYFKLVIWLEYKNENIFCKKLNSRLVWGSVCDKEIKSNVSWSYVINDLNGQKFIGTFYEKE